MAICENPRDDTSGNLHKGKTMKKNLLMTVCAGASIIMVGCTTDRTERPPSDKDYTFSPTTYTYSYNPPKQHHWGSGDGYSFNNDPYAHDALAPTLGLDPLFPPAPHPFNDHDR